LRAAGAVGAVTDTLASAQAAARNVAASSEELPQITARLNKVLEDAASATANINTAVEGVPELVTRIQNIAAKAESLAVEELVSELTALTRSADALISVEDAKQLPRALKRALDEVNYTLQTLREGGTVENVNRTLASARTAADAVAVTARDLPDVLARLNRLLNQASTTIAGYDKGDELSRSAQATLRDIQKAADALASLARTIERNPNSLLLGR
jgi:paraquat-inducible protein B